MASFAKVFSGVLKKNGWHTVAGPRILIPVDSRAFVLGLLRIATVGAATGQGRSRSSRVEMAGDGHVAHRGRVFLSKADRERVPDHSGRQVFACLGLAVCQPDTSFVERHKTKLGFVNFW
jgi:hypothetical protein